MAPPTLVTTPGDPNANSYCTRAEADTYHEERLHSSQWPANISASAMIGSGDNGVVTVTVVAAGTEGNDFTIEVVNPGTPNAPLAAAETLPGEITVSLATDGAGAVHATNNSAALVATAINSALSATYSAVASGTGATQIPVTAETAFAGGSYREDIKNPALIMATRQLDAMYEWASWATTEEQSLRWPRTGVEAANELEDIGDREIPKELKWAVAEFARQLIVADLTANSDIETQGITSLTAGPVSLAFKDSVRPKVVPDAVSNLIPAWWGRNKGKKMGVIALARA